MEEKLYTDQEILRENLSFGSAMDYMVLMNHRITRSNWGGYWKLETIKGLTNQVIVAYLKDGKTKAPAMPYQEDMLAHNWIVLRD
jgi:hypothetical protein